MAAAPGRGAAWGSVLLNQLLGGGMLCWEPCAAVSVVFLLPWSEEAVAVPCVPRGVGWSWVHWGGMAGRTVTCIGTV